jgi:hypothetical protein
MADVIGGTISEVSGGKFANGAVTAAFAQAFGQSAARKNQNQVEVPDDIKFALETVLDQSIDGIEIVEDSKWANFLSTMKKIQTFGRYWIRATTQENTIYLSSGVSAEQFFNDAHLMLHEYSHVLDQWNNGRMRNISYIVNPGRWETEAIGFADKHERTLNFMLGRD